MKPNDKFTATRLDGRLVTEKYMKAKYHKPVASVYTYDSGDDELVLATNSKGELRHFFTRLFTFQGVGQSTPVQGKSTTFS